MQVTGDSTHVEFNAPYNDVASNQDNSDVDLGRESCISEFATFVD